MEAVSFEPRIDKLNGIIESVESGLLKSKPEESPGIREKVDDMRKRTEKIRQKMEMLKDTSQEHLVLLKNDIERNLKDLEKDIESIDKS